MGQWRKIPSAWIANLGSVRWTPEQPAPDAVGFIWAVDQLAGGVPISIRGLSAAMGWTRRHGDRILKAAKEWDKLCTKNGTSYAPPKTIDTTTLQAQTGQKRDKLRTKNGTPRARAVVEVRENRLERQNTNVGLSDVKPHHLEPGPAKTGNGEIGATSAPADSSSIGGTAADRNPSPMPEKAATPKPDELATLWADMEAIRLRHVKGRTGRLGKRRDTLRRRVAEHSVDIVLHAWQWLWESSHKRAQYLRDEGYGVNTFLRASNLRDYVDMAATWDKQQEIDKAHTQALAKFDIFNTTDDDFDEHGNLIWPH